MHGDLTHASLGVGQLASEVKDARKRFALYRAQDVPAPPDLLRTLASMGFDTRSYEESLRPAPVSYVPRDVFRSTRGNRVFARGETGGGACRGFHTR